MKLLEDGVATSGELMADFFAMSDRMINNIAEKVRYEKICEYLMQAGAEQQENQLQEYATYQFLKWQGELYLIPEEIFDELDEKWLQELEGASNKQDDKPDSQIAL